MAVDSEPKRWSMLALSSGAVPSHVFNPETSGLSSVEKITVLQHYGGIAWDAPAAVVEVVRGGGRRKRVKRYVVEVDGELFDVENISQAQAILQQVRDLAEESAERDVRTEVEPKPPRIKVITVTGKATTSQVLQREVKRTQDVVRKAYNEVARRLSVNREISNLMLKSIEREDEEAAIMLLL